MVEKCDAALKYKIGEQITKFNVKMRNFVKNSDFFFRPQKNNMEKINSLVY